MRILLTGSRDYHNKKLVYAMLDSIRAVLELEQKQIEIIVGDCPSGLDSMVLEWCQERGVAAEKYIAFWNQYGNKAGPLRNQEMLDSGIDLCLAFPLPHSRGTFDCMRRAKKAGVKTIQF